LGVLYAYWQDVIDGVRHGALGNKNDSCALSGWCLQGVNSLILNAVSPFVNHVDKAKE